jgi:hypothetical protein
MIPLMLMSGTMSADFGTARCHLPPYFYFPHTPNLKRQHLFGRNSFFDWVLGLWFPLEFQIKTSCTEIIRVH